MDKITEIAVLNGGQVKIVMGLAPTPSGAQAPVFTIVTPERAGLAPNTISLPELAVLSELVKLALRESISMCSTAVRTPVADNKESEA